MTNNQLVSLLTSADDAQMQQAVTYFEQQKQIPQDLFTECLVAWQLIKSDDLQKRFTKILKANILKDWHLLLQDKYSLKKYQKTERNKGFAKKLAQMLGTFPITFGTVPYKDWIAYLFPYFPELLWQVFFHENRFSEKEIKGILQKTDVKEINFSFLGLTEVTPFIKDLSALESISWNEISVEKVDLTILSTLPQLKVLNLAYSKIKYIPRGLTTLKNLTHLNLNDCLLSTIPIAELTKLEELKLSKNPLLQEDFKFLGKLIHLKKLTVWSEVFLKPENTSMFQSLKACKKLNFNSHRYGIDSLPIIFTELDSLEELDLAGNDLFKVDLSSLSNLKQLKKLNLAYCRLSQLPVAFTELTALEELNLKENRKYDYNYNMSRPISDFSHLASLKRLKKLNLSSCALSQWPIALSELPALEELNLEGNREFHELDFSCLASLKHLKKLDLTFCKLPNLPASLSKLTALEELILKNNGSFDETDFSCLVNLKQLKSLDISHCKFTNLPVGLDKLTSLQGIDLEGNDLSQASCFSLAKLSQLKAIGLDSCKLNKVPAALAKLNNLEILNIYSNDLSQADFSVLTKLPQLKHLDISLCKLKNILSVLRELTALEGLGLGGNNLSEADLSILAKHTQLKSLRLFNTSIQNLPDSLKELTSLEILLLSDNDMSQADFSILASISKLKFLDLSRCKLVALPNVLSALDALEELILEANNLSKADLLVLIQLPHLKKLNLKYCDIGKSPSELLALQEKGLEVVW